jgi:AraC family transcriptional regulator
MSATGKQAEYEGRLLRVLAHIQDHVDGDLSLDALAEVACMSRFHWHRVFRAMTGETLADAVRRIRLLRAANALVREDRPIEQIAARYGYSGPASFSRAFRAALGVAPGEFREQGVQRMAELRNNPGAQPMFPVTIKDLRPCSAAGVLHVGPYADMPRAFQQLGGILAARNLFAHAQGLFAIYHDAPGSKPDAELRAHVAVIVGAAFPPGVPGLEYFNLTGGRHAVLEHTGPYATLAGAYDWLYGVWLPRSGEEPRDAPPIEFYVNDPRTAPPNDLRTDIRLPVE